MVYSPPSTFFYSYLFMVLREGSGRISIDIGIKLVKNKTLLTFPSFFQIIISSSQRPLVFKPGRFEP
jgi:hypothetical protein